MTWFLPWRSGVDLGAEYNGRRVAALAAAPGEAVPVLTDALACTESVMNLDDICFFAPSRLVDPRLARRATPMRDHPEFEGRGVATRGGAILHVPEGDFIDGRRVPTRIRFGVVA